MTSNSASTGRRTRRRTLITGNLNTGVGGKFRSLGTTRLAPDGGGDREHVDRGAGQRALAAHAHALDDGKAVRSRPPGDAARPHRVGQRKLDRGAVLQDLDVAGPFEL